MNLERRAAFFLIIPFLVLLGWTGVTAHAETEAENSDNHGFIFIPAIFYTPETKLAGGASVIHYFRQASSLATVRPSTVQPTLVYTQRNQIIASVGTDLYWSEETYRLTGGVFYQKYPDKFYGIGAETTDSMEEDYTPKRFGLFVNGLRKVGRGLNVGFLYELGHETISESESGGLLDSGGVPGSEGGTVSGAGLLFNLDTRDNIFYPTRGHFHQFSAAFFGSGLGSDFAFNRYIIDLRQYFPLGTTTVFAVQGFASFINGEPPFQSMSRFGGQNFMRGYYEGRYRDKHALVLQAEYRQRLVGRIGFVGFLGLGEVASELGNLDLQDTNLSVGLGLRYLWSTVEGINVRIDVGFSGGSPGPYITINEAF
ncbi:BamA/TamA family outer membrane protein [bacterium]|nr:BamA/TamA family outer membrane protein [bacterium]